MACSILRLYVSEEESQYSVEEVFPPKKIKEKQKKSKELSTGSKWIYEKIKFFCNNPKGPGYCYAKNEYFMEEFGVKEAKTIRRWLAPLKEQGLITTKEYSVKTLKGWERRRNIYLSKNVCEPVTNDRVEPVSIDRYNEFIKEERMNDIEEPNSSSSSLENQKAKASPKQDLMKNHKNWCDVFKIQIKPHVYERWRRLDPQGSYVDETLKNLHKQYSEKNPSKEFSEKELQAALSQNYYGFDMPAQFNRPNP